MNTATYSFLFLLYIPRNMHSPGFAQTSGFFQLTKHCIPNAARVRIMPAYAGEGRYFVMVPEGSIEDPQIPGLLTNLLAKLAGWSLRDSARTCQNQQRLALQMA